MVVVSSTGHSGQSHEGKKGQSFFKGFFRFYCATFDTMKDQESCFNILKMELKIPEKYLSWTEEKIDATVHKKWLASFLNLNPKDFITHDQLNPDEIAAQPSLEELGAGWSKVYIKVYKLI